MVEAVQNVIRQSPRVSLNKLGEYSVASATRRARIIKDQKRPKTFIVNRYQAAETAIISCLSGSKDVRAAIHELTTRPARTPFIAESNALCVDALRAFEKLDTSEIKQYAPKKAPQTAVIRLGGVDVSVHPNAVLMDGTEHGLLKLYICKSIRLTSESARFVTSTLHHYAADTLQMKASEELAAVIDVFGSKIYLGVGARVIPIERVIETCRVLRGAWDAA